MGQNIQCFRQFMMVRYRINSPVLTMADSRVADVFFYPVIMIRRILRWRVLGRSLVVAHWMPGHPGESNVGNSHCHAPEPASHVAPCCPMLPHVQRLTLIPNVRSHDPTCLDPLNHWNTVPLDSGHVLRCRMLRTPPQPGLIPTQPGNFRITWNLWGPKRRTLCRGWRFEADVLIWVKTPGLQRDYQVLWLLNHSHHRGCPTTAPPRRFTIWGIHCYFEAFMVPLVLQPKDQRCQGDWKQQSYVFLFDDLKCFFVIYMSLAMVKLCLQIQAPNTLWDWLDMLDKWRA